MLRSSYSQRRMNVSKISVAVTVVLATFSFILLVRYYCSPTALPLIVRGPIKKDWEYYQGLPSRLIADYYPEKKTHVSVLKQPTTLNKGSGLFNIVFLVKSAPKNYARRKVIRTTWGSILSFKDVSLHLMFIMGTTENFEEQNHLDIESEKYGDILQVNISSNFMDSPKNFLTAFLWIRTHPDLLSDFYIATEDDCIVNIAATIEFMEKNKNSVTKSIHCGYMMENNTGVIRGHGSRSMSQKTYPNKVYPAFCRGKFVILAQSFIAKIHHESTVTNITDFHLDDVLLYGILREKLGIENSIKNVKNGGFPLVFSPWDETDMAVSKMLRKWVGWKKEMDEINDVDIAPGPK